MENEGRGMKNEKWKDRKITTRKRKAPTKRKKCEE